MGTDINRGPICIRIMEPDIDLTKTICGNMDPNITMVSGAA